MSFCVSNDAKESLWLVTMPLLPAMPSMNKASLEFQDHPEYWNFLLPWKSWQSVSWDIKLVASKVIRPDSVPTLFWNFHFIVNKPSYSGQAFSTLLFLQIKPNIALFHTLLGPKASYTLNLLSQSSFKVHREVCTSELICFVCLLST